MIDPRRVYQLLGGEWDKTAQPLKERGIPGAEDLTNQGLLGLFSLPALANAVAPVGTYEDGSTGLAWPQIVAGPAQSWKRMVDSAMAGDDAYFGSEQAARDSFDTAGLAMTGGLGVGLAGGLADDAVRAAPRMSPEIRQTASDTFSAFLDGVEAGTFKIRDMPNAVAVTEAFVAPEFRRRGVSSAAHGAIQDITGKPLTPDDVLTPDGYEFWKANYPEAVRDYVPNEAGSRGVVNYTDDTGNAFLDNVPSWRMSGGPNRPDGVAWSNAPTGSMVPLGMEAQDDPALWEYLRILSERQ